ncbi:hypothetical protein BAUCODRAFT_114323 [Baudoinia panamericana UAMH 10762]|uniref:Uncharacterized protein n=1 Tax=Baudoinia panamericana (strain UAMH 10762) TaxID=717646 RepID=M2M897_BAUPA|nr:uncharacterized protein BAUCODRAFT_114323 [Baudoinia panamericana UAMH 10762]EMC92581.1 hypothetical protein BAUCODRAFT_114323 [Baudoinia panamericana UAMH 10762]
MLVRTLLRRRVASGHRFQCSRITLRHASNDGRRRRGVGGGGNGPPDHHGVKRIKVGPNNGALSLAEQLFPKTKKDAGDEERPPREIPRLPLESPNMPKRMTRSDHNIFHDRPMMPQLEREIRRQDELSPEITVLVLRNASKNLVEEDFRRLVPQGQHMEGWMLEQGDIIKVLPGRDLATLEQGNYYYLLFKNRLSAFTYQGHVSRMFQIVAQQTPTSTASQIPPPPGYKVLGMDAHAVLQAFTLVPASQKMDLRMLSHPMTPAMDSLVKHQGYKALVRRPDRMPFEVRLTLEGPQLQVPAIRHVLVETAKDRSLPWSGGDDNVPRITKWEPTNPATTRDRHSPKAGAVPAPDASELAATSGDHVEETRRSPQLVYILGFCTELAAQRFLRYWHRRPMTLSEDGIEHGHYDDIAPITNVEMLW